MAGQEFSRYRALVADLAKCCLAQPSAGLSPRGSIALALPAARLLLRDDPIEHAGLVSAMRTLAAMGRPYATLGVNVGSLGAALDEAIRSAAAAAAGAFLQRHGLTRPDRPRAGTPSPSAIASRASLTYPIALTDPAGHSRDVYHPLAVDLCLAAFGRCYETLTPDAWSMCEQATLDAVAPLRLAEHFITAAPPPALTALVLWQSLALTRQAKLLGRDVDLEMIDAVVQAIVRRGGEHGSLHPQLDDDSPDGWVYRELSGLHALASLALLRRNAGWSRRVEEIAHFHLEHTQPDHTTSQPWGLFAFLWPARTRSFAEQQLHDVAAHGGGPLAALLLAHAAEALSEFE
jgi:hypothetical protein